MEYQAVAFTFVKQGIYDCARKVPNDLRDHDTSGRISFSLRTRKAVVARARATKAAQQLDEHWHFLRMQNMDLPGKHLLRMRLQTPAAVPNGVFQPQAADEPALTLSEAVALYLRLKGNNLRPSTGPESGRLATSSMPAETRTSPPTPELMPTLSATP